MARRRYALINKSTGTTSSVLDDITDVTISGVASDDLLQWNGSAWVNVTAVADGNVPESAVTQHQAAIDHDTLTNFVSDEHVAHSGVSIVAGSGLTGGGTIAANRTINVGAGTGISVAADAVSTNDAQIDHDALLNFVANEHLDWTGDQGATNIHVNNITGLTTSNFTSANVSQWTNDSGYITSVSGGDHGSLAGLADNDHPQYARLAIDETVTGSWLMGDGTDISPNSSSAGQLRIEGNAYRGYVALDATGMHFGHNSTGRTLTFDTNETTRMSISGGGTVNIVGDLDIGGTLDVGSTLTTSRIRVEHNAAYMQVNESDAATDESLWLWGANGAEMHLLTRTGTSGNGGSGEEPLTIKRTGTAITDIVLTATTLDFNGNVDISNSLYIGEQAAADGDTASKGQVWVKNATPNELWFTSGDGVDHRVAGGSLSETFGKVKETAEIVTSSTTLQNDDELFIEVAANSFYAVYMTLELSAVASGSDFRFDFSIPTGASGSFMWWTMQSGGSAFIDQGASASWTTDQTDITVAGSGVTVLHLVGSLITDSSGTFQLRWAQNTSDVDSTIVQDGSSLMLITN